MTFLRSPKVIAGLAILVFFVLMALFGPLVAPHTAHWQASTSGFKADPPSGRFWLGTLDEPKAGNAAVTAKRSP